MLRILALWSRARRSMRMVSASDSLTGGIPGGQGRPAVTGSGASPV